MVIVSTHEDGPAGMLTRPFAFLNLPDRVLKPVIALIYTPIGWVFQPYHAESETKGDDSDCIATLHTVLNCE